MDENPMVGLSVAVVKDGKIIYAKSFGLKDLENEIPLKNQDIFRIASISKSFTSTSLMQLVQKKKLHLDDDISKLIGFQLRNPNYPSRVITLKMLLSHTSSINDKQGYFSLDSINPATNPNWQKSYNDYEPGTKYQYCNYNYNIAGAILERVSGERFDHYILNHILKPLNIYGGFNVNELDSNLFARIYSYNKDLDKFIYSPDAYAPRKTEIANYVKGYSAPIFSPAGGMKISATGLAQYMLMHMHNGKSGSVRIISSKSEKLIREPLTDKENYGLGLLTNKDLIEGVSLIGHTGGAYGLLSAMFFEPEKKYGFVVISNGSKNGFAPIVETIRTLYEKMIK